MAMTDQPFAMFPSHVDLADDFGHYSEQSNPQAIFATSGPMDVSIPTDAFVNFNHHSAGPGPDAFAMSMGYVETSPYAEAPNYMLNSRASPGMYAEDSDMRLPSSSLSTASAPSAASSAIGSPQSNHGQIGTLPEWAPQMNIQPAIVSNDYMSGPDFGSYGGSGIEKMTYGFDPSKAFVGKF